MKPESHDQEERELRQLDDERRKLLEREKALDEVRRKLEAERAEADATLPPSDIVQWVEDRRRHMETVTRTGAENLRREYKHDSVLVALLVACAANLLWWAWRIMHGI